LATCSNIDIPDAVLFAEALLAAGAQRTPRMRTLVTELGQRFEFHRSGFAADSVDEVSAALEKLYRLFDVPPVGRRAMHDGVSPISVPAGAWQSQHATLWELLVPSSGAAATVQGEVIRLSGRLAREILDNGAANWDADFKVMVRAFGELTSRGHALGPSDTTERDEVIASLLRRPGDDVERLAPLAVRWVLANPTPLRLETPAYRR
jgi:hypothetical protein